MAEPFPMEGVILYLAMGGRAGDAADFYTRSEQPADTLGAEAAA